MCSLNTGDSDPQTSLFMLRLFQKSVARIIASVLSYRLPAEATGTEESEEMRQSVTMGFKDNVERSIGRKICVLQSDRY